MRAYAFHPLRGEIFEHLADWPPRPIWIIPDEGPLLPFVPTTITSECRTIKMRIFKARRLFDASINADGEIEYFEVEND
jgi:hypothetical protein